MSRCSRTREGEKKNRDYSNDRSKSLRMRHGQSSCELRVNNLLPSPVGLPNPAGEVEEVAPRENPLRYALVGSLVAPESAPSRGPSPGRWAGSFRTCRHV